MLQRMLPVVLMCLFLCGLFSATVHAGKMEEIKTRGALVAGVKDATAPFGYVDSMTNRIVGFDIDICQYLAQELKVRLTLRPVSAVDRIPLLNQGAVDLVVASMTHNYDREELVDFSIAYFKDGQKLLVNKHSNINSVADLADKFVSVVEGATSEKTIKIAQPKCTVVKYESYPQAFLALKAGEVDAMVANTIILQGVLHSDEVPEEWKLVGGLLSVEPYAIAVPENDSDFRDFVNKSLAKMWITGEYEKIYNKWFGPDSSYTLPLQWKMDIWP